MHRYRYGTGTTVYFTDMSDVDKVLAKLEAKEWHVATYAQVTALSRHSTTDYGCVAMQAVASCNRFTAEQEVERTQSTL